jgi:leucyl-tRNA synthetase
LNDDIFSFIFLSKPIPDGVVSAIPMDTLLAMRQEFEYWYPWDLRVSAKDLIPNHLTMSLYNHVEIWKDRPQFWPKGIYCNGHIMVDAEKMSKSKGNFLMLLQCVEDYSADATRFACADAGDSMEDANFDRSVANNAVQYLYNEEEFVKMILGCVQNESLRTGELLFMDRAFNNEMDYIIEATFIEFEKMCYREGIHRCWFDLIIIRDLYRDWSSKCGIALHKDVILRFINVITIMMEPICPHWSENIWTLLGNSTSVCNASWPSFTPCDRLLRKQFNFFKNFMKDIRMTLIKLKIATPRCANVYIASTYEEKKVSVLKFLQSVIGGDGKFPADLMKIMKDWIENNPDMKKDAKLLLQFGAFMRDEANDRGPDALATEMTFDQKAILEENISYITKSLDLTDVTFYNIESASDIPNGDQKKKESSVPGKPAFSFYTKV